MCIDVVIKIYKTEQNQITILASTYFFPKTTKSKQLLMLITDATVLFTMFRILSAIIAN